MSDTVIKIENLSKIYSLGVPIAIGIGTGTLSHCLARFIGNLNLWWKMNILGKEDPFAKVGHTLIRIRS